MHTLAFKLALAVIISNRVIVGLNCFSALSEPPPIAGNAAEEHFGAVNPATVQTMFIASHSLDSQIGGRPYTQQHTQQQPWKRTSTLEDRFEARPNRPVQIVVVEDNPGDVDLLRQALADQRIAYHLLVLEDGRKALSFFEGVINEGRELPSFIILDLNLPAVSGISILETIRGVPCLSRIPVAILTSSTIPEERDRATAAGVEAYWNKPHSLDELESLGESLAEFFRRYNIT